MSTHHITLLIEDDPASRGDSGPVRQLEYACVATSRPSGPFLTVRAVRNTNTHETITDPSHLPPLEVVIQAAHLYDWSWTNQQVFDPGLPMVNGRPFRSGTGRAGTT